VEENQHDLAATCVADIKRQRNDGEREWALLFGAADEGDLNGLPGRYICISVTDEGILPQLRETNGRRSNLVVLTLKSPSMINTLYEVHECKDVLTNINNPLNTGTQQ
jgi:hypothetical protein